MRESSCPSTAWLRSILSQRECRMRAASLLPRSMRWDRESCFAIGDSAGGGLAVSAVSELHRTGAPLPACIVLVSALVDLTVSNPSFEQRASIDPICAKAGTRRNAAFYLGGQEPDDVPAAFPMLLDLSGFPPCLVLVGGAEVLRDDSRNLADKLEREGVDVDYHEYDDMIHVWPLFSSFLPQGRQALEEIGAFVGSRVAEAASRSTALGMAGRAQIVWHVSGTTEGISWRAKRRQLPPTCSGTS